MLASVHIPPVYSVAAALLLAAVMVWYWVRLGRRGVPPSRRRIRRVSLALMLASLPVFVTALSVVDPAARASAYVIVWSLAGLCLLLVMVTAVIDALNNIRLHREMAQTELLSAAAHLVRSAQQQREASQRERMVREAELVQHNGQGRGDAHRNGESEPQP